LTAEQLGFSSATGKTSKKPATKDSTVMYKKGVKLGPVLPVVASLIGERNS
jgi:hypothetical protein